MTADLRQFIAFIRERESVRVKKERGDPWPWTDDPILRAYRFCNIRREDDKETKLIHKHWLTPHRSDPDLWFAMATARLFNWWPTLEAIGYPVPFDAAKRAHLIQACAQRKAEGDKVFTGAYMVRADPHVSGNKATYIAEMVLLPMWEDREHVRPRKGDTLSSFHARLMLYKDMGPFIAGQIVADTKHTGILNKAPDRATWATQGPGSARGLNRLYGRAINASWTRHRSWGVAFGAVRDVYWATAGDDLWLDAQNIQNCLCEFDKYQRVKLGQGRPRSTYAPPLTILQMELPCM